MSRANEIDIKHATWSTKKTILDILEDMRLETDDHSTMSGGGRISDSEAITPQCQAERASGA